MGNERTKCFIHQSACMTTRIFNPPRPLCDRWHAFIITTTTITVPHINSSLNSYDWWHVQKYNLSQLRPDVPFLCIRRTITNRTRVRVRVLVVVLSFLVIHFWRRRDDDWIQLAPLSKQSVYEEENRAEELGKRSRRTLSILTHQSDTFVPEWRNYLEQVGGGKETTLGYGFPSC